MAGVLILEDGTCFPVMFSAIVTKPREVVINTGILGYQEISTDPTYYGQIVVLTYP